MLGGFFVAGNGVRPFSPEQSSECPEEGACRQGLSLRKITESLGQNPKLLRAAISSDATELVNNLLCAFVSSSDGSLRLRLVWRLGCSKPLINLVRH